MPEEKLTLEQFGQKIKTKYPQYKDMPDVELANKMLGKFPDYKDMVVSEPVKKKEPATVSPSESGSLVSPKSELPVFLDFGDKRTEQTDVSRINKPIEDNQPVRNTRADLEKSLTKVTPKLVGKEEESVVPELNYQFKNHGFKFEESGIGDAMTVKAPNGKTISINLDPFMSSTEVAESKKLQDFIKENSIKYEKLSKVIQNQDAYNKKFLDEKEIEESYSKLREDEQSFSAATRELSTIPKDSPEYFIKAAELEKRQEQIEKNKKTLEKSVGKYAFMKAQQGTTSGYLQNKFFEGIAEAASGFAGLSIDVMSPNWVSDAVKKEAKKDIQPKIREGLDPLKDENTTKEYAENAGFVKGAVGGLAESLPAMLSGPGMPIVMYAQISDNIDQEMSNNPEFENISEDEKLAVKVPIGIVGAALETLGFRNAIASKGLMNKIALRALGKSTTGTTAKTFRELVDNEIESGIARGALIVTAGGLAEAETGFAQEVTDIGIKDIYNAAKEKKMFDTPEGTEYIKQVLVASAQEAIGGKIMSVPSAMSSAYKKGNFNKIDDETIEVFSAVANDPKVNEAIDLDLKMKVNSGELTPEEAETQLNDFRQSVGVLNSIDTEGLEPTEVKEKMGLAKKVKELELKKEGKIPSDKKIIQTKIDALNEKLITIGTTKKEQDALTKDEEGLKKSREKQKLNKDEKTETTTQAKTETIRETDVLKDPSPAVEESAAVEEEIPKAKFMQPIPESAVLPPKEHWQKAGSKAIDKGNEIQDEINKIWAKTNEESGDSGKADKLLSENEEYQNLLKEQEENDKWRNDIYHALDIKYAIDNGSYQKAIAAGEMSPQEAVSTIKSVGLEVPSDILAGPQSPEPAAKELSKKRIADAKTAFIKASKNPTSGGLYALPEFIELVQAYIADGVLTAKEFIKRLREDNPTLDFDDTEAEKVFNREAGVNGNGGVKKTVATVRAYEGEIREGVKKELEKLGLTREIESQSVAKSKAKEFVESVGEDAALEAVRNNDVRDAAGAYVWNELIESIGKKLILENNPDEIARLEKLQAQLFDELSREALSRGRFNAALDDIYQSSEIVSYNVEKRIKEYKDANQGEISAEIEAKFRDLDKQYQEVRKKLAEAEERAKISEGEATIQNIKDFPEKGQKASAKIRKDTDWIVTKIKEAKIHRPGMFAAATPASLVWDGAVESVAAAIKITGRSAEAIAKGIEYVKESDWYKSLSTADKASAIKQFADFWKELQPRIEDGKIKIPGSLIHDLVEGGADTIEKLVAEVKEIMIEDYPDVSDRQIRDAITEYGKTRNLNREEIATQIRKIKRVGRIVSALEDVNAKKRPLRSGVQRDKLDAQERALNKELREAMKELPVDEALEAEQQKTATDAAKQRLQNQIEDLQREIDKGELVPRKVRTVKDDAELISLKARRDKLKAEHEAIFKDEEYQQAKRLEITKKNTQRRIEDLQRRLREGDFSKKKKTPLLKDSELIKLRAEKLRIQDEYDKELYKVKLKNRTKLEKWKDALWEIWGIPRILMATGEASFVGIQGLKQSIAHPTHAAQAFKNSWQAFKSEKNAEKFLNEIKAQDWYGTLKDSKLALTEPKAEISAREELFYSGWTNMIWDNLGKMVVSPLRFKSKESFDKAAETWSKLNPFKAVERAAIGYLDTLRVMRFLDGMVKLEMQGKTFDKDPKDFKDVADFINTMTGRASLGKAEMIAPTLSKVFFSPRNWASGIKTATPYALYHFGKMTPTARKMAIADFSKFLGFTTAMVALAAVALDNDDDEETKVELDPRSTDFMKIKLGNTRVDPWGGMQQQVVLSARLMAHGLTMALPEKVQGAYKKGDEVMPLGVYRKTPTAGKLIGQQAINKLNPTASILYNFLTVNRKPDGTLVNDYGQEYTLKGELGDKFNPIFWGTVGDLLKDDPTALDGLLAFYAFWGGGVNVYDNKSPKSNREKAIEEKLNQIK